ncbi:hypothetical protein A7D21_10220 [Pseudomonas sp. AP19]|nr:hypothetical protein A7D21_10220 [Pseudomonas sp. AP19]
MLGVIEAIHSALADWRQATELGRILTCFGNALFLLADKPAQYPPFQGSPLSVFCLGGNHGLYQHKCYRAEWFERSFRPYLVWKAG